MALLPDVRNGLMRDDSGDRHDKVTGGILSALVNAAVVVTLLLVTWQSVPKQLPQPRMVTLLLPALAKPPPAPLAVRPRLAAPPSIAVTLPQFDVAAPSETAGADIASRSAPPPKPAASASPAFAPPNLGGLAMDDLRPYYAKIIRYLQARIHKPARAGREGTRPTATIHVMSDRNGHVLLAELLISSGYDDLDQEAVAVVKRSDPLPPMPADTIADHINVNIPVVFNFEQDALPYN